MSSKRKVSTFVIYIVTAIIFTVLFLAFPFQKNNTTWVAFTFGCIAIIAGIIVTFMAFNKGMDVKSKVYRFPMFRLGYYYITIQLLLAVALFIAEFFVDIPIWIPIVFGVALLGAFIIGTISIDNVRDIIVNQENKGNLNTEKMEKFRVDIKSLINMCTDEKTKNNVIKLLEEFNYSDPVSSESTKNIENEMSEMIVKISSQIKTDQNTVNNSISELRQLLEKRNMICKMDK